MQMSAAARQRPRHPKEEEKYEHPADNGSAIGRPGCNR
jgi:hypothetical protein